MLWIFKSLAAFSSIFLRTSLRVAFYKDTWKEVPNLTAAKTFLLFTRALLANSIFLYPCRINVSCTEWLEFPWSVYLKYIASTWLPITENCCVVGSIIRAHVLMRSWMDVFIDSRTAWEEMIPSQGHVRIYYFHVCGVSCAGVRCSSFACNVLFVGDGWLTCISFSHKTCPRASDYYKGCSSSYLKPLEGNDLVFIMMMMRV